jgi:hypothetical protein
MEPAYHINEKDAAEDPDLGLLLCSSLSHCVAWQGQLFVPKQ